MEIGVTWGNIKEICREAINKPRLPLSDYDHKVYVSLCQLVKIYNDYGSDMFLRWNGSDFQPSIIEFADFEYKEPMLGKVLNEDVHNVVSVYDSTNQKAERLSYDNLLNAIQDKLRSIGVGVDFAETLVDAQGNLIMTILSPDKTYYAVKGNILFVYAPVYVRGIYYSYQMEFAFPETDDVIIRIEEDLIPFLKLLFKQQYYSDMGLMLESTDLVKLQRLMRNVR